MSETIGCFSPEKEYEAGCEWDVEHGKHMDGQDNVTLSESLEQHDHWTYQLHLSEHWTAPYAMEHKDCDEDV